MIFCVEDDTGIRELMIYTLISSGFEAKGFAKAEDFWQALETEIPSLIMLDIMLPDEDGIQILKKLRAKSSTEWIPVIMATAKGTEYDKVKGLDMGADDYLVKPFGMMEMISHIKAVLRRSNNEQEKEILANKDIVINTAEHTVTVNNERISLTIKEYEILLLFIKNLGRVFTREQLLSLVWDYDYAVETRTVDVHIRTLRTKLGEYGDYITTVRSVGYRMEAIK